MPQPRNDAPKGPGRNGATAGKIQFDKNSAKTIKRLIAYLKKGYIGRFIVSMCLMAVASLISVASGLFLKFIIDDYIEPLLLIGSTDLSGLARLIILMAGMFVIGIITNFTYNIMLVRVSHGVLRQIRFEMFDHMQKLPVSYFDTHSFGDIMSHYTNDTDNMRQMLSQSIPQVLSSAVTIVGVLVSMIWLSIPLTLIELLSVVVMYVITMTLGASAASYFKKRQAAIGEMNGYIEEMMNGQKVIKVFCHEQASKEGFDDVNLRQADASTKANIRANVLQPVMGNLGNFMYVILAISGGALALSGKAGLTLGDIASFLALAKMFNMPVSNISQQINSVVMALAGAGRVFELLDEKEEADLGTVSLVNAVKDGDELKESAVRTGLWAWKEVLEDGSVKYTELKGNIVMKDVDFSYIPGKQILYDISLYAKPGQKIAFVGSTGAGKTTITNLLNRFYDIEEGSIEYDGIDIKKIKNDDLRHSLGIVLQDVNLFTGTIRDNIRYGRLDATDEEVEAAAKLANAHDFIVQLPDGYDTVISGTGSQLSQGQCQLLSIARCAASDPPVMILDEATSSVDTRTETLIQDGMDRLMGGRTTFVIAHRLSTVQNSNAIMVLEGGRIIERGDHPDLMNQKGRYYTLCTGK